LFVSLSGGADSTRTYQPPAPHEVNPARQTRKSAMPYQQGHRAGAHDKHHQTYVGKANVALEGTECA